MILAILGIPILTMLLILLSAASLAITMIVLAFRRRGSGEPSCGNCGYGVRGLPTFTCPECGSDLRQVGIVSSAGGNPFFLLAAALASAWKRLLLCTLLILALIPAAIYGSIALVLNHDVFPNQEVVLDPASKSYRVTLNQTGDIRHASGSIAANSDKLFGNKLAIQIAQPNQAPDHNTDFHIDLSTWSSYLYHWTGGTSPTLPPTRFNRGELEKFFKEKNIDTTAPAVSAEIDSLMLLIDACRSGPLIRLVSSAQRFSVAQTSNKTAAQLNNGGAPPGMFFLTLGSGVWIFAVTAIVIARMFKLAGRPALIPADMQPSAAPAPPLALDTQVARTITILFSDIKDFTAHSAATPRSGAVELARRHRDLALPILQKRRGHLVKTIGDALLVTFESATDAVLAGLEIQAASRSATIPGEAPLNLRIAVATGEAIVEAGDVYGETVNLASRLQGVAQPGDVVLSAPTRALINGREVETDLFGEHQLAGFQAPVQVFVARPVATATTR